MHIYNPTGLSIAGQSMARRMFSYRPRLCEKVAVVILFSRPEVGFGTRNLEKFCNDDGSILARERNFLDHFLAWPRFSKRFQTGSARSRRSA